MMTDTGHAQDHPIADEAPVDDRAVRVLVWLLIGAILFIAVVAVIAAAKSLLALIAGATTLIAVVAVAAAGVLTVRVLRLEERVKVLEDEQRH